MATKEIKRLEFDYFYASDAEKFQFYKLPKFLFTNDACSSLSSDAKILYSICLDRLSLSMENGWRDEQGRIYIAFTVESIKEELNCSRPTAIKAKKQLEAIGLLEDIRKGQGKSNFIYLKDYASLLDSQKSKILTSKKLTSRSKKSELPKVKTVDSNKTEDIKTKGKASSLKKEGLSAWEGIISGRNRYSSNKNKVILDSLDEKARESLKAIGGLTKLRSCDAFEEGRLKSKFLENYESQG